MLRTTEREREWKTMKLKWMKKEGVRKRDSFLLPFLWRRKNGFLKAARISISFFISTTIFFTTICTNIFLVYLGAQCSYTECDSIETQIEGGGRWVGKEDFNHYHQPSFTEVGSFFSLHFVASPYLTFALHRQPHIFIITYLFYYSTSSLFERSLLLRHTQRECVCVCIHLRGEAVLNTLWPQRFKKHYSVYFSFLFAAFMCVLFFS